MKQRHYLYLALIISFVVANAITLPILISKQMLVTIEGSITFIPYIRWVATIFVIAFLFLCVVMSHKFSTGKFQEVLFIISALLVISIILSYLLFALISCKFEFMIIDWFGSFDEMSISWLYYLLLILVFLSIFALYCFVINKNFISILSKNGPSGKLKQVSANFEDGTFANVDKETQTLTLSFPNIHLIGNITHEGTLSNSAGITSSADITDKKSSMQAMRNIYNAHKHTGNQGSPTSAPDKGM